MDASTVAAIAALVVAFVALLTTFAQALQQYVVSGQLIRICDSVVYGCGKLPGQGHRVWEFSQFRFRIVYSIPRISLLGGLWDENTYEDGWSEGKHRLPSLGLTKSKASRSSIAGEAAWVSFARTAQHGSEWSMRYEMVEGDADRCPTDLPVVPMQLSMRDVIVLAIMAGMECTDVSFELQSLSMQGSAGTITSSRHPILGSLIHFAPKQPLETHGIRVLDGTVNPIWLERMSDTLTVANVGYKKRDRRHFEEDEKSWVRSSGEKSVIQSLRNDLSDDRNPAYEIRMRRQSRNTQSDDPSVGHSSASQALTITAKRTHGSVSSRLDLRRPQDGNWSFSSGTLERLQDTSHYEHQTEAADLPSPQKRWPLPRLQKFAEKLRGIVASRSAQPSKNVLPTFMPKDGDVQPSTKVNATSRHDTTPEMAMPLNRTASKPSLLRTDPKRHLDREDLEDYISEKRHLENSRQDGKNSSSRVTSQLLLTSRPNKDDDTSPTEEHQDRSKTSRNQRGKPGDDARADFVVNKWQQIFKERQKERSKAFDGSLPESEVATEKVYESARYQHDWDDEPQRTSTWPPIRSHKSKKGANNTFPRTSNAPRDPGRRPQRIASESDQPSLNELFQRLHRGEVEQNTFSDRPSSVRGQAGSKLNTFLEEQSPNNRRLQPHQASRARRRPDPSLPRRESTSSEEDAQVRRGRRRNSSLTPKQFFIGHHDSPFMYGHGPVLNRSPESTSIQSRNSAAAATKDIHTRQVRIVSPSRSPTSSSASQTPTPPRSPPPVNSDIRASDLEGLTPPRSPPTTAARPRGILRAPRQIFPEDPNPIREGVAPARLAEDIPSDARWTKIDRRLVNPEALDTGEERYQKRPDHVIVLRVLTKDEIQAFAVRTAEIRGKPP